MFKEYLKRTAVCVGGLALYSFGNVFCIKAGDVGTNAWNTLSIGISGAVGITFGTATFLISLAVIIIALIGRGKLGFGTLLNVLVIPVCSDIFLPLMSFVPAAPNLVIGVAYTLFAQIILSFATIFYMMGSLGCGPRDTLMIILGRKLPKVPVGLVKFIIECCVLVIGILLGAPFGLGTLLVMALQASMFQLACKICRYEPRNVAHEDFAATFRRIAGKVK